MSSIPPLSPDPTLREYFDQIENNASCAELVKLYHDGKDADRIKSYFKGLLCNLSGMDAASKIQFFKYKYPNFDASLLEKVERIGSS